MKKKNNYFKANKAKIWFVINMFFSVVYLTWRIFFTIPIGYGIISVTAGVTLLIVEALGLVEAVVHFVNMYNNEEYGKPEVPLSLFPDVDIFISTYNEDTELVEKTIRGCKRMDYPDKNKVHIYLCDDGRREIMKELAKKLSVNYLDRDTHEGQKAGNLNHALANTSSPYVVTFDADMIPQSCFLMETMPYFVDVELRNKGRKEKEKIKLGFLQTPQSFYDLDLFQFNLHSERKIPNEQDYFYRDIEVARTKTNSCIYGGSNTIIAREALEAIGGFYTKAITEDFATGILIQKAGYVTLSISKRLASGTSANSLQDLIQQRVRWARGVISTGRKMHIYTSTDLSFGQKINYWASIWYWYAPIKRLSYIMSPILYGAFGFMVFRCTLWEVLLFWLPMYVTSNISLRMLSNNIRNTKWTAVYEYALFPYMIIPIILETFGISLKKFKVTSKGAATNERGKHILYMIPLLILIVLSIIGIIKCVTLIFISNSLGPTVVLFWLIYNLYAMFMCLFFVDGRNVYRKANRVYVELDGNLYFEGKEYSIKSKDLSETGAAIYLDEPILLDNSNNREIIIELYDERWKARFKANPLHAQEDKKKKQWIYSFSITNFEDEYNYDQYLALLYDRVPLNPSEIKKNNSVYDDLKTNISNRVITPDISKRHYPRITINADLPYVLEGSEKKNNIKVIDFNYQFFSTKQSCREMVKSNENQEENDIRESKDYKVIFIIGENRIVTNYEGKRNKYHLYKVLNFEEIYFNEKKRDEIMEELLTIIVDNKLKNEEITNGNNKEDQGAHSNQKEAFDEMDLI